jgi:hypothetical protein
VHSIGGVLLPPSTQRNVVTIATGNTQFSTLVELLTAADLVTTLSADATTTAFTVFAPTNAAFAKIDAATITCLKKTENKVRANTLMTRMLCILRSFLSYVCFVISQPLANNSTSNTVSLGRPSLPTSSSTTLYLAQWSPLRSLMAKTLPPSLPTRPCRPTR